VVPLFLILKGRRRLLSALWWRWRWWIWVRPLLWSCSPCGSLSSLTSSFKGGTWCRLGLKSGSLVPSFVGWSCRDFSIWFYPWSDGLAGISSVDLNHRSLILVASSGTRSNSSTRQLMIVSFIWVYGRPLFLLLLQNVVSISSVGRSG
jgi:hypothetical protein